MQALQPEPADGQKEQERPPRGGFTDVGLHTGGSPRDTAWPLVWEAFKVRQGSAPCDWLMFAAAAFAGGPADALVHAFRLPRSLPIVAALRKVLPCF